MQIYRLSAAGSLNNLVKREEEVPVIGPHDVLVRIHAVSLNARDLMMIFGPQPYGPKTDIVPTSDGAGEIVACGSSVNDRVLGTRVVIPFRPGWIDGSFDPAHLATDLGGAVDGVLSQYVRCHARSVVELPTDVPYEDAATLPCAGVTAWSALMRGAPLRADSTVLILGTGGVSIFALQIAKALGCKVIATTSSESKALALYDLGADHVINYVTSPDWDVQARELTGGRGVDRVIEVGGAGSLPKSMAALGPEGEVSLIGLLDNPMNLVSPIPLMASMGVVRGISVGSRADLVALLALMRDQFKPKVDKVFSFDEAHEALTYLASRKHVGKIVIRV